MRLSILPESLAICRLPPGPAPSWPEGSFVSVTRTADELSIVCAAGAVPPDVPAEHGFRAFKVEGPLDFALTGILAEIARPLARAGISIFAIATFDTDYVLVREFSLAVAIEALRQAGHEVV